MAEDGKEKTIKTERQALFDLLQVKGVLEMFVKLEPNQVLCLQKGDWSFGNKPGLTIRPVKGGWLLEDIRGKTVGGLGQPHREWRQVNNIYIEKGSLFSKTRIAAVEIGKVTNDNWKEEEKIKPLEQEKDLLELVKGVIESFEKVGPKSPKIIDL